MTKSLARKSLGGLIVVLLAALMLPCIAFADQVTIEPSKDQTGKKDKWAIAEAINAGNEVLLVKDATYYVDGSIYINSTTANKTAKITATGATIIGVKNQDTAGATLSVRNYPTAVDYKSMTNIYIDGGTWKQEVSEISPFYFSHSSNITLKNMVITTSYAMNGHAIELIACKDVLIDNVVCLPTGKADVNSCEETIQIDVATAKTAPWVNGQGAKYSNGACCENVTIQNCLVKGCRGICANYSPKDSKYIGKYHKNITLKNNTVIGETSEAVALFNVAGATVENNNIVTMCRHKEKGYYSAYTIGLHFHIFGAEGSNYSAYKNATYNVKGNNIMGARQGVYFYSHTKSIFGTLNVKSNMVGAMSSEDQGIYAFKGMFKKLNCSGNRTYQWDGKYNTNIADTTPGYTTPVTDGWKKDKGGWWYEKLDGKYPKNCWYSINSYWYHFNKSGYLQTGWQKFGGNWFYLGNDGAMRVGWYKVGKTWYFSWDSGAMAWHHWVQDGSSWYYMTDSGAMKTGWFKDDDGSWYYFDPSTGKMKKNCWVGNSHLNGSGVWDYSR